MTRKQFIELAEILGKHGLTGRDFIDDICAMCKRANPAFNPDRFISAVIKRANSDLTSGHIARKI